MADWRIDSSVAHLPEFATLEAVFALDGERLTSDPLSEVVRIERDGNQRWLVVKRPADALWEPVRDFWNENGFVLTIDQPNLGIMETDWAENRAKLPQDIIRSTIGKIFDSVYSTGERDKFRTRLERGADAPPRSTSATAAWSRSTPPPRRTAPSGSPARSIRNWKPNSCAA